MRFPEFEGEWEEKKLGEICKFVRGPFGSALKKEFFINDGYAVYEQSHAIHNNFDSFRYYISEEKFNSLRRFSVEPKDIIMSCSGTMGKFAIIPEKSKKGVINQALLKLTSKENFNHKFIKIALELPQIQNKLLSQSAGGAIKNVVGIPQLKEIGLYIPKPIEQNKIASFLSLIDQRIETQNKIIEKYESLIKGIMDFHFKKSRRNVFFIKELGEYFNVMNLSKGDLSDNGKECILYGELFTTYGCVINEVKSRTTKDNCKLTLSSRNDLLFPSSTTVDAYSLISPSAILKEDIILGGDMFGIHINENFNNEYLSYLFNYIYKQELAKYAKGSTIIHLHYNEIRNAKIEIPSLEEQRKSVKVLRLLQEKIIIEKCLLQTSVKQKEYLLQQMFI
ncbi:type I restriction enzyme S subunit [Dysgonomonas sp. PF1-14]|uniref:restriction endonuclease subunit S n=1 Tax=Dysgonomonas sp. PF1-14 TaxID=2940630 RepID=UPI002474BF83|nr:restriction endonuclease subunit S [Dysgonomonas sp. PF1-14]MDH6310719.1 type I restriction enzyme S subunit [Dysgonomonas sp. PF1-14]